MIKAIETEYNGVLYRSRLEARWAMFFDHMGYVYEYEPEGYVLEDGTKYIPDFKVAIPAPYLNKINYYYVEVKPLRDLTMYEINKANLLVKGGDLPLLLVQGNPSFRNYFILFKQPLNGENIVVAADFLFDEVFYGIYIYHPKLIKVNVTKFSKNPIQQKAVNAVKRFRFEFNKK